MLSSKYLQFFKLLILSSLLILIKGDDDCGLISKPRYRRIVGGEAIGYVKYPWYAALVLASNSRTLVCGGTLINKRYVITAAHCFKPFFQQIEEGLVELQDIYLVKLGVKNICVEDANVQTLSVSKVYIPEEFYNDLRYSDIALMELEEETDFMPACLPPARYESNNRTGLNGTAVGLGKESSTAWRLPCQVKEISEEIQADAVCRTFVSNNAEDAEAMHDVFCAGNSKELSGTCQGDSGGPLQVTMDDDRVMVLGIASFGFSCALNNSYDVFTDVSHYLDWIYSNMQL